MSDAGDTSHKRSKSSAAFSLLRRDKNHPEEESGSEEGRSSVAGSATSQNKASSKTSINMSHQASVRSQSSKLSANPLASNRSPSSKPNNGAQVPPIPEAKGPSLEQSVKKFRVVEALRKGDTSYISKIIKESSDSGARASISSRATTGGSPLEDTTILHLAIQCAEFPVIESVITQALGLLDLNARDKDGNTPLHVAAVQGRTNVVKLLLEQEGINDAIMNSSGKLPIDLARNPDIFQLLQLSKSLFTESKVKQVQVLIAKSDYDALAHVLDEPRVQTVIDINSTEFVTEPVTLASNGTLLHEAARKKNAKLIQVLLMHGADPFRRDRKGKLAQSIASDETIKALLKKSPAAIAAQRGIQEKAVLGHAASQAGSAGASVDPLAGREAREMKGYLKKWTNYRKGYQLRWFVLEDGVLSYYKHQDDAGSACRGAINTKIARLHMSPDEKTKFEIIGKSSVKYTLKANHEVEAKRWFWALNNSIQWTKDQAREEQRQAAQSTDVSRPTKEHSIQDSQSDVGSVTELQHSTSHVPSRSVSSIKLQSRKSPAGLSAAGSVDEDDYGDAGTEADGSRHQDGAFVHGYHDDDEDFGDDISLHEEPNASKDALNITAQSAKLQLETMTTVHSALVAEQNQNPNTPLSDATVSQALSTYDAAIRSLTGLLGDLLRISKDRDAFWQYKLDREANLRRMWEESMAQVALEQEQLEARVGEAETKKKAAKKMLREVIESGAGDTEQSQPLTDSKIMDTVADLSDDESLAGEEFFDAVDAGEVEVTEMLPDLAGQEKAVQSTARLDISSAFKGYENGVRLRLKIDNDNRPKVSLWGILKSMIGKDMTKMTLPVTFNEPTSLLYRAGEDMEYADLLDLAAERSDSIERLVYVAAFAASEFASTIGRVAKPFNPLLGETFEYVRPDKNYRFFTEQVSHHPPIGAVWSESPNWTYWGESNVKSKFYGKSFDINHLGTWFLKLRPTAGGKEDLYTWKKPTSTVVGIITGNPTVDNYGPMELKNWTTGETAVLDFKARGWKASSAYQVSGKVCDADGNTKVSMGGRWNSKLYARLTPGYEVPVDEATSKVSGPVHRGSIADPTRAYLVWQAHERPTDIPFNLTPFVLTFNHLDDKLRPWIAPTDSRLRPDQRAMEDGEYDLAATEKNRLEQGQRVRRRVRDEKGEEFKPAWFHKARCEVTGEEYWQFNGDYWKRRAKAGPDGDADAWAGLEPIYQDQEE